MTLVELAEIAIAMNYSQQQIANELQHITIFEPVESEDELEDTNYFIGDNNSWLEVYELVELSIITRDEYIKFHEIVNNIHSN